MCVAIISTPFPYVLGNMTTFWAYFLRVRNMLTKPIYFTPRLNSPAVLFMHGTRNLISEGLYEVLPIRVGSCGHSVLGLWQPLMSEIIKQLSRLAPVLSCGSPDLKHDSGCGLGHLAHSSAKGNPQWPMV